MTTITGSMNVSSEEQLLAMVEQQQREHPFGQLILRYVDQALRDRQPVPMRGAAPAVGRTHAAPVS
jgi:hypothetical protein